MTGFEVCVPTLGLRGGRLGLMPTEIVTGLGRPANDQLIQPLGHLAHGQEPVRIGVEVARIPHHRRTTGARKRSRFTPAHVLGAGIEPNEVGE